MSEDNKVETPENPIENSTVDVQNENSTTPATTEDQNEKVPKKKYALLMGYLGTEYQGLQINKNCKTIEAEILRALHDAKLVSDLNYNDEYCTTKIQYMRAARTDKGVHAAGNCAHVKLLIKPNEEEEACEEVNRHLPSDIRLFKIQRVTRGFQAKNNCDKRRYEYIMPLECLKPKENKNLPSIEEELIQTWTNYKEYIEEKEKGNTIAIMSKGKEESDKKDIYDQLSLEKACSLVNYIKTYHYTEDEQDKLLGGCVPYDQCPEGSQGMVDRLRAALYLFKGSHRFHNYTVGKNSIDPRSLRTMYGFLCSDPVRIQDHLYLRLCVEGQSFMLNQIRKMVGAAIEVARGSMTLFHLFETMGKGMGISHLSMEVGTVSLPIAPSTGLFLDYCIYDLYNQKPEVQNKLDFTEPSVLQKRNEYKKNAIYPHIDDEIVKNHVFQNWLDELDRNYNGYPITPIEINNIPAMEESTKNKMDKIKQKKMESIARRKRDNDNNDKYSIENAKKRQRMEAKENM